MAPGTIVKPDHYNSLTDTTYQCIVCGTSVGSEALEAHDPKTNRDFIVYSPASRYYCLEGVFCSPECALQKYQEP